MSSITNLDDFNYEQDEQEYKQRDLDVDIKDIIVRINRLNVKEKAHILNILKMANIKFTKNSNGYFFNFLDIKDDILEKICNCLELMEKNAGILKEMDRRRTELLNYYKNLIEERLQNNIKRRRIEYLDKLKIKNDSLDINIKRKCFVKRKRNNETYVDPDILIREYTKQRFKYEKGGVYHRIMTCIRLIRSNRGREVKSSDDQDSFGNGSNDDNDTYNNKDDDSVSVFENENTEIDVDEKSDLDIDEYDDKYMSDNEMNEDANEDVNEEVNEDANEEVNDEEDRKTSEDKTENDFLFYKNLLNQQGFQFNDNKNCVLLYQSYIS